MTLLPGSRRLPAAAGGAVPARIRVAARDRAVRLERSTRRVLPGLLLTAVVGLAAHLVARQFFPYALAVGFEVPLAMLLGLVLVNLGRVPAWALPGIRFSIGNV